MFVAVKGGGRLGKRLWFYGDDRFSGDRDAAVVGKFGVGDEVALRAFLGTLPVGTSFDCSSDVDRPANAALARLLDRVTA